MGRDVAWSRVAERCLWGKEDRTGPWQGDNNDNVDNVESWIIYALMLAVVGSRNPMSFSHLQDMMNLSRVAQKMYIN